MGSLTDKAKKLLAMTSSPEEGEARTAAYMLARLLRENGAVITFPGEGSVPVPAKPRPAARPRPPVPNVQTPPRPPPTYAARDAQATQDAFREAAHAAYEEMFQRHQQDQQDRAAAHAWAEDFMQASRRTTEAWRIKEKVEAEKRRKDREDREDAEREEAERRTYKFGKPVETRAKQRGSCHCCAMNIEPGDKVLWVKGHGVTHEYCKLYWLIS